MTITLTVPDELYRRIVEMAGRHDVSAERVAAAALAE
jgi:predicted transcriptional regulator